MSNPPIIDTEFIKLSFTWALCLKQIFWLLIVIGILYIGIWGGHEPTRNTDETDEGNYPSHLDEAMINFIRDREQREMEKQEKEKRLNERKQKISNALSARSETTKSKLCSQCGGTYGTGSTCQYCGQP